MKFIRILKAEEKLIYVGNLKYLGQDTKDDLYEIYFSIGGNDTKEGDAFAILKGPILSPVFNENNERLSFPEMAGLDCDYNKKEGILENFRKD